MNKIGKTNRKTVPSNSAKCWSERRESNHRMQPGRLSLGTIAPNGGRTLS
jgi:hypothetical protein